jgi:LPS-assembly lipoprotein
MSSSDWSRPRYHRRLLLLAIAPALALAACTVQPLYGPSSPSGAAVATGLTHISITQVDTRVAQEVRNRLIFLLYGGAGQPTAPLYNMKLTVTSSESPLGVTPVESAPAYSVTVAATYEVTALATGDVVLRATIRGSATYDRVNQVFANTRAKLNAENRAASEVADDIRTRLAVATAQGTI